MSGSNHIAGGMVFTGVFLSMYDVNIFSSPTFIFFTAFFSLLPDADHTKSFIGKLVYPIAKFINRKYGHRTITHSLMFYIVGYVIVSFIAKSVNASPVIPHIYLWAYGSHLIFDMLTKQGIPLFYPFKKNPCVMPANPVYRLKASDLKTEASIFLVFGLLAFTCKDLFANGFWNTYNKAFDDIKHTYAEQRNHDGVIRVIYNFSDQHGEGYLVESTPNSAILFTKNGFLRVDNTQKIQSFTPIRTALKRRDQSVSFTDISMDSFRNLIAGKPIIDLKIQSSLPLEFSKENQPQSSTSANLSYVFNPVFKSNDLDSINADIEKQISLLNLQLAEIRTQQKDFIERKQILFSELNEVRQDIKSLDLATKERAIRDLPALEKSYTSMHPPADNSKPLLTRLRFLQDKLHIRKTQSISGFISYITFK